MAILNTGTDTEEPPTQPQPEEPHIMVNMGKFNQVQSTT